MHTPPYEATAGFQLRSAKKGEKEHWSLQRSAANIALYDSISPAGGDGEA